MAVIESTNDGNDPENKYFKGYAKYTKGLWIWTNKFKLSSWLEQKVRWFTSILLEEQYADIGPIFTKQSDDFFCFKGVCGTKNKDGDEIFF